MKKNITIIILALVIIVSGVYIGNLREVNSSKQDAIDKLVTSGLSQATNGFNLKYNEMELNDKQYRYAKALVGVNMANELLWLSSYNDNKELDGALYSLQYYMNEISPLKQKVSYDVNVDIYNLVQKMVLDIKSEEKAKQLKEYLDKQLRED